MSRLRLLAAALAILVAIFCVVAAASRDPAPPRSLRVAESS